MFRTLLCVLASLTLATAAIPQDTQVVPDGLLEDILNGTIEGLRPDIPEEILVDQIVIGNVDDGNGQLVINDLTITGLHGFQVTALAVTLGSLGVNFTVGFPELTVSAGYVSDLVLLGIIPLNGEGDVDVDVVDAEIEGSVNIDLSNGTQIKNLRVKVTVGSAVFQLTGLFNDDELSELISDILTDLVGKILDEQTELVTQILSPILELLINSLLQGGGDGTKLAEAIAEIQNGENIY